MDLCQHRMISGPRKGELCGSIAVSQQRCKKHPITAVDSSVKPTKDVTTVTCGQQCCYMFAKGERIGTFCGNPVSPGNIYCNTCVSKKTARQCHLSTCQEASKNYRMYCDIHFTLEPAVGTVMTSEQYANISTPEGITKRRSAIPQVVREQAWRKYLGGSLDGPCYCCGKGISFTSFHAGHVIPDTEGGQTTLENLRPVCASCNLSMGTMWMNYYVQKYGLTGAASQEWPVNKNAPVPTRTLAQGPVQGLALGPVQGPIVGLLPTTPGSPRMSYPTSYQYQLPSSSSSSKPVANSSALQKGSSRKRGTSTPAPTGPYISSEVAQPSTMQLLTSIGGAVRSIIPPSGINENLLDTLLEDFDKLNLGPIGSSPRKRK